MTASWWLIQTLVFLFVKKFLNKSDLDFSNKIASPNSLFF